MIYECSITVGDLDFRSPREAAEAMLRWIRENDTEVFVNVRNRETGEHVEVEVFDTGGRETVYDR